MALSLRREAHFSRPVRRVASLFGWSLLLAFSACGDEAKVEKPADVVDTSLEDTSVADTTPEVEDASEVDLEEVACTPGVDGCPCEPGFMGCECDNGNCQSGQCVSGLCKDCRAGDAGCVCRSNGLCGAELRCEDGLCVECPEGEMGCPCLEDGTCSGDLVCEVGLCAPDSCRLGAFGCPCRPTDRREGGTPRCEDGLFCGDNGTCQTCASDVPGCPCEAGACTGGLVCEGEQCRKPLLCEDLRGELACLDFQRCEEGGDKDARCSEACVDGYKWVSELARCVACESENCAAEPNCTVDAPGSILATCNLENRDCVEFQGSASCGECKFGAVSNGDKCEFQGKCRGTDCGIDEYCDWAQAKCNDSPCGIGEAQTTSGRCERCTITCSGPGLTGRVWPFRTRTGECVCEVEGGYYLETGGTGSAVKCDADGDGWVRREAGDATRVDLALKQNTRCQIRTIGRVRLEDEYGTSVDITPCYPEGPVIGAVVGSNCTEVRPLRMLESRRNDVGGALLEGFQTPPYDNDDNGRTARRLDARELNSLTKFCVSTQADFNDDGTEDLLEIQRKPSTLQGVMDDQIILRSFAFFGELNSAEFVVISIDPPEGAPPVLNEAPGTLVIRERSRCDARFPLRYDPSVDPLSSSPADAWTSESSKPYWRNCDRSADPAFSDGVPGFDFAQWTCAPGSPACGMPAPAVPEGYVIDADNREVGLCHLRGAPPGDGRWRGMHHHSQFKCVALTGDQPSPSSPWRVPYDRFWNGQRGDLVLNRCEVGCAEGPNGCADSRPSGGGGYEPVVVCSAYAPEVGLGSANSPEVGFAAVRFRPYGARAQDPFLPETYQGGCINEDEAWGQTLCPAPQYCLLDPESTAIAGNFGRHSCYGSPKYGLWAARLEDGNSSTLYWANIGSASPNMTVWAPKSCR
jgi:hypothetical protein